MTEEISKTLIVRGEKAVSNLGWSIVATSRTDKGREKIREILKKFKLSGILYHPNLLIKKDKMLFFVIFSEKKRFPISTKKREERIVSGVDWFKYRLAQFIEKETGIQVGLMMYSNESSQLIIRQMNQLKPPEYWFKSEGCLLSAIDYQIRKPSEKKEKRLKKIFEDPPYRKEEDLEFERIKSRKEKLPILDCMKCFDEYPNLCYRCIKGKHKKIKALAIWEIGEFESKKLTVQNQLFIKKP
jgi:hypothetical protein